MNHFLRPDGNSPSIPRPRRHFIDPHFYRGLRAIITAGDDEREEVNDDWWLLGVLLEMAAADGCC